MAGHRPHKTVQSVADKKDKADERERKGKETEEKKKGKISVQELWKPHGSTLGLFVAAEKEYAFRLVCCLFVADMTNHST